jgi:hypothetical protein
MNTKKSIAMTKLKLDEVMAVLNRLRIFKVL